MLETDIVFLLGIWLLFYSMFTFYITFIFVLLWVAAKPKAI